MFGCCVILVTGKLSGVLAKHDVYGRVLLPLKHMTTSQQQPKQRVENHIKYKYIVYVEQ